MTPVDLQQRAIAHIQSRFSDAFRRTDAHQGQHWVEVERSAIVAVLRSLRDDLGFDVLMDLTCVDWLGKALSCFNLMSIKASTLDLVL